MKLELTHDLLAEEIYNSMTRTAPELVQLRRKEDFVHTQFGYFQENGSLLSKKQLEDIEPFVELMDISEAEHQFIKQSQKEVARLERQRRLLILSIILILIVGIISTSLFAYQANQSAKDARRQANISEASRLANLAQQEAERNNRTDAVSLAHIAYEKTIDEPLPLVKRALTESFHKGFGDFPLLMSQVEHQDEIRFGRISPKETCFATVSTDHKVFIWSMKGALMHTLEGHDDYIQDIIFSFDGQYLATASSDGTAKVWSVTDGQLVQTFSHEGEEVIGVGFSPGYEVLITLDFQRNIRLYTPDGEQLVLIMGGQELNPIVSLSPDSSSFIIDKREGNLEWYDYNGRLLGASTYKDLYSGLAFTQDGQIVYYKEDRTIFSWNKTGEIQRYQMPPEEEVNAYMQKNDKEGFDKAMEDFENKEGKSFKTAMEYPRSYRLFVAIDDTKFLAPDLEIEGSRIRLRNTSYLSFNDPDVILHKHSDEIKGVHLSNSNNYFLSWSKDHTANLWSFKTSAIQNIRFTKENLLGNFDNNIISETDLTENRFNGLIRNPDGEYFYSIHDTIVRIWDKNLQPVKVLDKWDNHSDDKNFGCSPDGKYIYTINGSTLNIMDASGNEIAPAFTNFDLIDYATFIPGKESLLISELNGPVLYWSFADSLGKDTLDYHSKFSSIAVAKDASFAIIGYSDGHLKKWDLNDFTVEDYQAHERNIFAVDITFDGQRFLSASGDQTVKVFDSNGKVVETLEHNAYVLDASFSPSGDYILSSSQDKLVNLWNKKGKLQYSLGKTGENWDYGIFSPDGSHILTANEDNEKAALWQLDGQQIGTYTHPSFLTSIAFSPDGQSIITTYGRTSARIWLTPDAIYNWLQENPIVPFTQEEKKLYGIQ